MSEDENKKGFSGLSSLTSDVELTLEELTSRQARTEPSTADHTSQKSQSIPQDQKLEFKTSRLPNTEQENEISSVSRDAGSGSFGAELFLIIIVPVLIIWLIFTIGYFDGEEAVYPDSSTSVSEPSPSLSPGLAPAPAPAPETQLLEFEFSEPPVGNDRILSVEQIRWCLRQDIWIEVLRPMATTNSQIDQFNSTVDNYNSRCGSFQYYERTFSQAEQQVESIRAQIVSMVSIPWNSATSPAISDSSRTDAPDLPPQPDQNLQLTLDVQSELSSLGYDTGPIDGIYGDSTRLAIQGFQRDVGVAIDGRVTSQLLEQLQDEAASRPTQATITTSNIEGPTPTSTTADEPIIDYFTRGSHENDLIQVQGTPNRIIRFEAIGYEKWYFGRSTVDIDFRTRRVLEWDNNGNLNVQLSPGDQVTAERTFTRDSHADDVLRLQGTPARIIRFESIGYEKWYFGRSTVDIDFRTRRVLEWDNVGNLNVQLSPGDRVTADRTFTRNSHADDVLRLQGTPTRIIRFEALGYEKWYFDRSTVDIDFQTRRVLEWDNRGNLQVGL